MNNHLSVLQRARSKDVALEPYPHLILPEAIPEALYAQLAKSFPAPEKLGIDTSQNNTRWDYSSYQVRGDDALSALWRDFIAYHASQAFLDEVLAVFGQAICTLYPKRFPDRLSLPGWRAGVRNLHDFSVAEVLLDAQISGNTAVTKPGSVRTTHVDKGNKLFSGLFYMRPENYDAEGGDLTISQFKSEYRKDNTYLKLFRRRYVDDEYVNVVKTVPYERNTLVFFINSLESLHGVTVRQRTDKARLFVNLIGEIANPLYRIQGRAGDAMYLSGEDEAPVRHSRWWRWRRN